MGGLSSKSEEEAFYTSKSQSNIKPHEYQNCDKEISYQGTAQPWRAQKNDNKSFQGKRFEGIYYNCRKRVTCRDCWSKKNSIESNVEISKKEDEWDAEAICAIEKNELALMVMMREHIHYNDD